MEAIIVDGVTYYLPNMFDWQVQELYRTVCHKLQLLRRTGNAPNGMAPDEYELEINTAKAAIEERLGIVYA